ncbi:uncharacterized protein LOC122349531 [Puntigrus tetrazona]|uniref:uncharacterized protein LOC122349531 n=1 Tax=Puntigrus tetrazona TaxID=1606681 RepID=UPI001C8AB866|nr:uncharacterized protein LOC122349531 [Puntigrus tetrazona]
MGSGALRLGLLLMFFIDAGFTQEKPKPVLKVTPDQSVFRGETVTLRCDIQTENIQWTYSWFKDGYTFYPTTTTTAAAEISFRADYVSVSEYRCRGERSDSQRSSDTSDAVKLTVSDSPRSSLTVTPDRTVFTGERVTLKCVIEVYRDWRWRNDLTYDWRYEFYKDSVILKMSDHFTETRDTLTIRGVTTSDQGQYWCRGQIRSVSSQPNFAVSLSVKDSPRSSLTVTPDRTVFTGERVTLKCEIESYSDWRYEFYKDSVILNTSDHYTVTRDTLTIRGSTESDEGQYWCRGQREERLRSSQSNSVSLSVKDLPASKVTVTPKSIFTGETVNLTCVIESNHSDWRYEFYKDSVILNTSDHYTVTRDTLTIRGSTESDEGQYWCRGQREETPSFSQKSDRINLSLNVSRSDQISVFNILSFLLAACPYLLSTVVLLFKYFRERGEELSFTDLVTLNIKLDNLNRLPNSLRKFGTKPRNQPGSPSPRIMNPCNAISHGFLMKRGRGGVRITYVSTAVEQDSAASSTLVNIEHFSLLSSRTLTLPFTILSNVKSVNLMAMIDSGAALNPINRNIIAKFNIPVQLCTPPIKIKAINNAFTGEGIAHQTQTITLQVCLFHQESISLYVVDSPKHEIILGFPYLLTHALNISWIDGKLTSWSTFCFNQCLPCNPISCLTTSVEKPETSQSVKFPSCYQDQFELFSKTKVMQLPPHRPRDCAIDLLPNAMPPRSKVYPLSRTENQATEEYITEALQSGFIHPSTSPATAGLFFVEKKDGGLRPCIDYRGINNVTVKFRYPLSLVPFVLKQLREATIYTKLDLRSAYNLIRIKEVLMFFIDAGFTQEKPKPVLKVTPDQSVFRGETVTLRCDIQTENIQWTYSWFKDGHLYYPTAAEISFTADYVSVSEYRCRGERSDSQRSSDTSDAVKLTVSDSPRSSLTVTPDRTVFTGERVTLKCEIEVYRDWSWRNDPTYYWRYEFYKDSVILKMSDHFTETRDTLTIRGVTTSDQGQYWCRGQIRSVSSQPNFAVSLSVKDSPRSSLTVTPDRTVFTGERVTLKCEIESYRDWRSRNDLTYYWRNDWTYYQTPDWRYEFYKDSVILNTSDHYTVTRDTLTIRGSTESDEGQYWCRGQREETPQSSQSNSVSLSVKDLPASKVTVTPKSIFTGEAVNLTCVIESNHSDWRYEFYKDSVILNTSDHYTVTRDTLTIRGSTESDAGQYWCRGQREETPSFSQKSDRINLSFNEASSSLLISGVGLGLLFLFLFLILITLLLLWRFKKNKDQQGNINQTSVPNQAQPENSALQSADPEHIYDDVTAVNNRLNDDPESFYMLTYSEITVQKKTSVDKDYPMAESNEVTYSEVRTKGMKCKSKDADAGVGDATYAIVRKGNQKKKNSNTVTIVQ